MTRELLPTRRANETIEIVVQDIKYTATLGFYDDGRPGEVFLNGAKVGTVLDLNACEAAVMASLALQYGAELEVLRHAVKRDASGAPQSPIGVVLDMLAGVAEVLPTRGDP